MEIALLILGIIALLVGLAGAVLPLPGPPLSFVGLLLIQKSNFADFSTPLLVSLGIVTLVVAVLDYYIPIWGTKRFGGTKYGSIGATIGLLGGFFIIPALGIFIGTFLGALVGELLGGASTQLALRSAFGSFVGFLGGIVMKVLLCLFMIGYALVGLFV
jgi:uncharacterized protein YqgC (DUF456 family)